MEQSEASCSGKLKLIHKSQYLADRVIISVCLIETDKELCPGNWKV